MNINQPNAEKFMNNDNRPAEERPEQRDPIEELNPISLLKKPGTPAPIQTNSNKLSFRWPASPQKPSKPKTTNEQP